MLSTEIYKNWVANLISQTLLTMDLLTVRLKYPRLTHTSPPSGLLNEEILNLQQFITQWLNNY